MADHRPVETIAEALRLVDDPEFQRACDAAHAAHSMGQLSKPDLLAFFDTWGVAPARNDGLYRTAFRHEASQLLGGRWGLLLVLPWTTEADIRAAAGQIHKVIGKRHRDSLERAHRDATAAWLRRSGFPHAEVAAALYGRTKDAKRPALHQIKKGKALTQVDRLVARYRAEGIPYKLAERRAYIAVRGTEGRGAQTARAAGRRAEQEHRRLKAEIANPKRANALTAAVTDLLHARFVAFDPKRTDQALNALRAALLGQPLA